MKYRITKIISDVFRLTTWTWSWLAEYQHLQKTMLAPIIRRAFIQSSSQPSVFPSAILLPFRAYVSTANTTVPPNSNTTPFQLTPHLTSPSTTTTNLSAPSPNLPSPQLPQSGTTPPIPAASPLPPLLPLLAAQPPYYIVAHLHNRPYLLTTGDVLRLPFHLPNAAPGTILRLNRASAIGSRDYTYRGKPWVDERFYVCRVRVMGVEGEPMRIIKKTKRRQRYVQTVKRKMRYTVVRCLEVEVKREESTEEDLGGAWVGWGWILSFCFSNSRDTHLVKPEVMA